MTVDSSPLTKRYPSDPRSRYRQDRVGGPVNGVRTNQVWTLTLNATGGALLGQIRDDRGHTFTNAAGTAGFAVAPTVTAAQMLAALILLVGTDNVTVTGGPGASGGGTPYVVTFVRELAGKRIIMSGDNAFLSGGAATATFTDTTPGGVSNPGVPEGPAFATNSATTLPDNSPRAREGDFD